MENQKPLQEHLVTAILHVLYQLFVYFLFVVPFDLWKKATIRLSIQSENQSLKITNISGLWPFMSFLKAFLLEFLFDGFIFLSYAIGLIAAIVWPITSGEIVYVIFGLLYGYYMPVFLSVFRDLFQLGLLPFRKYIDWAKKPAQHMDLDIKNK
ncbi:MAG: hypothetical protein JW801_05200 [Bacteroidales bacterium]|nr:hypothetical protein [Bacteroidales bacterium]